MEEIKLDVNLCNLLAKCVEDLTNSGQQELDVNILKQLKNICKSSNEYVEHTYHLIKYQLEVDHAEVRFSALLLCDELFRRSHRFRELLVADFQEFLELTVETDPEQPLPAPAAIAKKLRRTTLDLVQQWHTTYSEGYRKLALGYTFLKDCKKVDFSDAHARSVAERHHVEKDTKRKDKASKENLRKQTQEINDMRPEIDSCLAQMRNCFRLMGGEKCELFDDDDFKPSSSNNRPCSSKSLLTSQSTADDDEPDWTKEHGVVNKNFSLTVEVPKDGLKVPITGDNAVVMENLRDLSRAMSARYLPALVKWSSAIVKGSGPAEQLKMAIDLKNKLEETLAVCKELGVGDGRNEIKAPASDSDDDDFEEVESKEGYEPVIPQNRRAEYGLEPLPVNRLCPDKSLPSTKTEKEWKLSESGVAKKSNGKFRSDELQDPTSLLANIKRIEEKIPIDNLAIPSTSSGIQHADNVDVRKAELLVKAPKLRFDADLVNWGEKDVDDPSILIKMDSLHRFWTPFNNEDAPLQRKGIVSRHSRVSEFTGDFKPVKWRCRAPMPTGRLCPRQDRHKCPLHGPIIARDATGSPTDPKDSERLQKLEQEKQQANPDWQDPELLADIKAATGIDLTVTAGKRRGSGKNKNGSKLTKIKQKYPGLTDLKAKQSTSRRRLEKKVLNQMSVKRVAATLDNLDHKKFTDKYANQFNYSCQT